MKRAAAAGLLVLLFALQIRAIVRLEMREPSVDEIETLHASWLMSKGDQLYVSFFEHHSPLLYGAVRSVATDDVVVFFERARFLCGAFGIIAMLAFAALLWRVRPEAPVIAVGLLFASTMLWTLVFADVRAEPFALAFFWAGAALVLLTRHILLGGIGVGFVAIAALWNPKWPLCSAVVAAFWIAGEVRASGTPSLHLGASRRGVFRVALGALVALTVTAAALFAMHRIAPLDRTWFFMVDFNRALASLTLTSAAVRSHFKVPFEYAPGLLRPLFGGIMIVVVAARLKKFEERRIVLFFLALAAASLLELRFTLPYPVLWPHYYAMWSLAAAAVIAMVPASLPRDWMRTAVTVVAVIVVGAYVIAADPLEAPRRGTYWVSQRYLKRNLRAGETVWLYIQRHPVTVRDANYYWFSFGGTVPVARQLADTPRGRRFLPPTDDFPLCAIARGKRLSLRYVAERRHLPGDEARCFDRLFASQRIRTTGVPGVYEVLY